MPTPHSLFNRPGALRALTVPATGHHDDADALLASLIPGNFHPLRVLDRQERLIAAGFAERTATGYHLHVTDCHSENRLHMNAATHDEARRALTQLLQDLTREAA